MRGSKEMLASQLSMMARRHETMRASTARMAQAVARHKAWRTRSASYRESLDASRRGSSPSGGDSAEVGGVVWTIPPDARNEGGFSNRLLSRRILPLHEIMAARSFALGTAMLDIGANIGLTSIPRILLGDCEYVYAAEPEPANYHALVATLTANKLLGFVLPDRVAIGDIDGEATLHVSRRSIGEHELRPEGATLAPDREFASSIQVPCRTLDRWVEERAIDLDQVGFIKTDCQGWEGRILLGAAGVLLRRQIVWQIEFWPIGLDESGIGTAATIEIINRHFTHFIDLRHGDPETVLPISRLASAMAPLIERGRSYTNLLLLSAGGTLDSDGRDSTHARRLRRAQRRAAGRDGAEHAAAAPGD